MAVVDVSADFPHPGNAPSVGAAAGEELALATGRGQRDLTDLEGLGPYLREGDVHLFGIHDYDHERTELTAVGMTVHTVGEIRQCGGHETAADTLDALGGGDLDGFWVHLDADVLDPSVMPAVDSPDPDGCCLTSCVRSWPPCSPPSTAWASTSRSTTLTSTRTVRLAPSSPTSWSPLSTSRDMGRPRRRRPDPG